MLLAVVYVACVCLHALGTARCCFRRFSGLHNRNVLFRFGLSPGFKTNQHASSGLTYSPFFLDFMADIFALTQEALTGTAIELVDVERAPMGVLRIVIDHPNGVTVDNCEWVSKQLSRVFEVESVDYNRLEVSSPGVDRPLKQIADFVRFAGQRVEIRLREAIDNRKVFVGVLIAPDDVTVESATPDTQFVLELEDVSGGVRDLSFSFDEVERAKLDPVLDFKGRKR